MPTIQQLPPSVINKIAAGEVIERPASVVKELLENAVDSGATRVDVTVEQGGGALIRVADNGCGISADQLPLAVASHATSKIRDADDLFCVRTLGFRGEALASISEISHFRIRSRAAEADAGYELEVTGGNLSPIAPCGCPIGTSVEVRNLFYNTPVRRKFMRTTQTEMGHTTEAFTRIALANEHVHMTLRHGQRTLFDLPPAESWRDRIGAFFGGDVNENLIWVESVETVTRGETGEEGEATLSGFVADPQVSRSNNRMQYLFLNGRFIRDRALQHALGEAYRGLLMVGRFPIAFLRLDLPADTIDVNVHPTKLEVRFQDGGRIYSQLLATLRKRFLTTDLTAQVPTDANERSASGSAAEVAAAVPAGAGQPAAMSPQRMREHRQQMSAWAQGSVDQRPMVEERQERLPLQVPPRTARPGGVPDFVPYPAQRDPFASRAPSTPNPTIEAEPAGSERAPLRPLGLQVHNRYLVTEDEEGMVVIDQHALHERILYEQIRDKSLAGAIETQKLLVPEPVSLTAAESAVALDSRETLAKLGIEIEPFGGDTVLISAYPAMLSKVAPQEILRTVVDLLLQEGKTPERRDLADELLHMISCKAAIKAGDHLSVEEVEELLEQRAHYQDAHHCPHGRPTALRFSREELDRRFKRI